MKHFMLYMAAAAIAFTSCDKINDSLTRLPIDDISPDAYFTSESECQLWLNRCYSQYLTTPNSSSLYWGDESVNTNPFSIVEGTRLVSDTNTGEKAWGWDTMRRINLFFENAENCKDLEVRAHYLAEASFFRALGYYEKVVRFGDVPWYDHVLSSSDTEDLKRPRDPRGYVMLQIMKDLDYAIENLPSAVDFTRVNKWTALALKARAALFEGTWRTYHASDEFAPKNDPTEFDGKPVSLGAGYFLEIARDAAKAVIDCGLYSIQTGGSEPYRTLFNEDVASKAEFMLAWQYNNTTSELKNEGHSLPYLYTNRNYGFTRRFVNMYLCKDGSRFTDKEGYETVWFGDEVKDRDPRLTQTIMCPGYKVEGQDEYTINDFSGTTGYKPIKWASTEEHNLQNKAVADLPVFRYAEVLLIYAEAKAELGELTDADLNMSINKIRDRVAMPHLTTACGLDPYMAKCYPNYKDTKGGQEAVLLEIRRERNIELVLEGAHLWDMLRWREGAQLLDNTFPYYGTKANTGYYGVYIPGPGAYDMDGDGTVDFEFYETQPTYGLKQSKKLSELKLVDPENPTATNPTKGYITGYRNTGYCNLWQENRDYLYPVPQQQINLTSGALTQNPNW